MNHVTDQQLTDYLQGHASTQEFQAVDEHLQSCAACQERLAAMRSVWNVLGTWVPPPVSENLDKRILQSLPDVAQVKSPARDWRHALQVAAAVVLAIGLGHLAGRLTWKPVAPGSADETAAAESLYLDDANSADILLAALDAPEGEQP